MAGGEEEAGIVARGPMSGSLSGVAARKPVQVRMAERSGEAGHVFDGAMEHAREHVRIDGGVLGAELARRANEQLAGLARLHVEGDGIGGDGMRALQVAEFDQLMAHPAGVAVGDDQVAFAFADFNARRESGAQAPVALTTIPAETVVPSLSFIRAGRALRAPTPTRTSPGRARAIEQDSARRRADRPRHRRERRSRRQGRGASSVRPRRVRFASSSFGAHADAFVDAALTVHLRHLFVVGGDPQGAGGDDTRRRRAAQARARSTALRE